MSPVAVMFHRRDTYRGGSVSVDQVMGLAHDDFFTPNLRVRIARFTTPPFDEPVAGGSSVRGPRHAHDTRTAFVLVARAYIVRMRCDIAALSEFHAIWTASSRYPRLFFRWILSNKNPFTLFDVFRAALSSALLSNVPREQTSVGGFSFVSVE